MAWQAKAQRRMQEAAEHQEVTLEDEDAPAARPTREELADRGRDLYVGMMKGAANKPDKAAVKAHFQDTGEKFLDANFSAGPQSLIENWDAADYNKQWEWKRFQWKDIDEIFPQPIKVFNQISPNDIQQGALGDCYFLSTLSAMAEFPHRIEKLFETADYEPSGCYKVKIMDMGIWQTIIVDDYFPVTPEGQIAFSGPKSEAGTTELWVVLLEKAWAKRFGCYYDIEAGFTNESLTDLTGAPCEVVATSEPEVWDKVFSGNKLDYIITAGSGGSVEGQDLVNECGLVGLHAYAVIDAKQVTTSNGPVQLLMIRNPWGQGEWTGRWSDTSPLWTPAIRKQLGGWQPSDDGTFWMCLEDFCNYFTDVTICRVHDNFDQYAIALTQELGKFCVSQLSIRKAGTVYVMVCQQDSRCYNEPDYQYPPVRIIVAKLNPDRSLELLGGRADAQKRDAWDEYELPPGEYLVFTEVCWTEPVSTLHGLSIYAHHKLGVKNVTSTNPDFLTRVYCKELAQKMEQPKVIAPGVSFYNCERCGFGEGKFLEGFMFDVIDNTSSAPVEISLIHKIFDNLELVEPYSGDSCTVRVPAGQAVTVVKKQIDLTEGVQQNAIPTVKRSRK